MKHNHFFVHTTRPLALLLAGAMLLGGCKKKAVPASAGADSAPPATLGGSGSVPEAYLTVEPPERRGEGTPPYWPPNYQREEEPVVTPVTQQALPSSQEQGDYHITSVSLTPVEMAGTEYQLYQLQGTDYLIRHPDEEEPGAKGALRNRAQELLALREEFPDMPIYTYFINRATNCDWYADTEGIRAYDYASYFEQQLGTESKITCGRFTPVDLQDYMDTGYKLDFHLNHVGSYRAYEEVYAMMSKDMALSPMLEPLREVDYDNLLSVGGLFEHPDEVDIPEEKMDVFRTYQFDYGDFDSYVDGRRAVIGMEEEYESGQINRDPTFQHLFSFYGGQSGIVSFDFHQPDKPNLLMLSDSQGRPERKLLASHFNRTVYLDVERANASDLAQIIRDEDIGVVLMIGQISIFQHFL